MTAKIALFIWAAGATALFFISGNNFKDRADKMNALTMELTRYESVHGCLGPEIDNFFWLGPCGYKPFVDR